MKYLKLAVLSLLAFVSASCSPERNTSAVSPQTHVARLALAPTFSESAVAAYKALSSVGLEVSSVHILLLRLDGTALLDTVVVFPANLDVLSIDLPVEISGSEEQLRASIELRDAAGVVQFSTTQSVTAHDAAHVAAVPLPVILQYVGPGFTVKSLTVGPSEALVAQGVTQALAATGLDASGVTATNLLVAWTSSDTNVARVVSTGPASATTTARAARGTVTITATTPSGVSGSSRITFLPQAARLVVVSGSGQTGPSFSSLGGQFVVEVQGSDGKGVQGKAVAFTALNADGNVGVSNGSTDVDGRARTTLKLGRTAGIYSYQAASGDLPPVVITVTATTAPVGPPTQVYPLTALPSPFVVGAPGFTFSAQLQDANGVYVRQSGVVVTATLVFSPGNSVVSIGATSDAQGVLSYAIPTYNGPPGSVAVSLTSPSMTNLPSGTFQVVAKP